MQIFQNIINYILGLGSAIFVPLIIFILGLIARMKVRTAFLSAITLGVAFTGMSMVISFLATAVGPATEALGKHTGIHLPAVDLGWTGASMIVWSWSYAFVFFAVVIITNLIMLAFKLTKTLNVDMWNVWGNAFTAYLVFYFSHNLIAAIAISALQEVLQLKLGDMFQRHIQDLTGIPLVTCTHFMNSACVLLLPFNWIMDKIPVFNKSFDAASLKTKIGIFSENSVMGFIIGLLLGFSAAYSVSGSLNLAIQLASAMAILPMIAKLFMQSLAPLADAVSTMMKVRFKDREIYIGLDWPILAGRPEVWVTAILLVPVFIGYSMILPGATTLPMAGVINYSIAVGGLLITGGNLLRMLVLGIITMPIYVYAAAWLTPLLTHMNNVTGAITTIKKGTTITWSSFEDPEFRYLFSEIFNGNILAMIGAILFLGLFFLLLRYMNTQKVPSERYIGFKTKNN